MSTTKPGKLGCAFFNQILATALIELKNWSVSSGTPIASSEFASNAKEENRMRALIATDGSSYGETAVRAAAERSWPPGSEFRVLTVMERPAFYGSVMIFGRLAYEGCDEAERVAAEAAELLGSYGKAASHIVREGTA